jgi:hypothetical protein
MYRFILLSIFLLPTNVFGDTWVHYEPPMSSTELNINIINQQKPTYVPQNVYQWVPYIVNEPIVVEKRYLLIKKYEIEYRPVTKWVLRPIVIMP